MVCEIDRAKGKAYNQTYTVNAVPTLKTGNRYLMAMSVHDLHKTDSEREIMRWVLPQERPGLQGCSKNVTLRLDAAGTIHACGNAFPVPVLGAVLAPIVNAIAMSGLFTDFARRPANTQPPANIGKKLMHLMRNGPATLHAQMGPTSSTALKRRASCLEPSQEWTAGRVVNCTTKDLDDTDSDDSDRC